MTSQDQRSALDSTQVCWNSSRRPPTGADQQSCFGRLVVSSRLVVSVEEGLALPVVEGISMKFLSICSPRLPSEVSVKSWWRPLGTKGIVARVSAIWFAQGTGHRLFLISSFYKHFVRGVPEQAVTLERVCCNYGLGVKVCLPGSNPECSSSCYCGN